MARLSNDVIEKYRRILQQDPKSLIFAALADGYRENGQLADAEALAREGVSRHPNFARGWVVLGRILAARGTNDEALATLDRAIRLEPDNILAHQTIGDIHLSLRNSTEALRSYKKVLFLNPLAQKARKVVEKLESQTAADYDDETFAMAATPMTMEQIRAVAKTSVGGETPEGNPKQLLRLLSLIDAFIARNDFAKALDLVEEGLEDWGQESELTRRQQFLRRQTQTASLLQTDDEPILQPSGKRTRQLRQLKAKRLGELLEKVQKIRKHAESGGQI